MGGAIRVTDIDLNILKVFGFDCEQALTSVDAILNVCAEILSLGDFNFGIRVNLHASHDGVGFLQLVVRAAIPDKAGFFNGQRGDVQTEVFELVGGNRVIPASRERGGRDREDHDESDCESQNLLHFFCFPFNKKCSILGTFLDFACNVHVIDARRLHFRRIWPQHEFVT